MSPFCRPLYRPPRHALPFRELREDHGGICAASVHVRPQRWRVAAHVSPGWEEEGSFIARFLREAPSRRSFYVGRVEEVLEDGTAFEVHLWERPSGREGRALLEAADVRAEAGKRKLRARAGDAAHLWTWEKPGGETCKIIRLFRQGKK